ncbi:unnamed protein product, partial [Musa textilis]
GGKTNAGKDGADFFFLLDQIGGDLSSPILLRFVLHLFSWIRPAMALKSSVSRTSRFPLV